ncbi:hypothetical protein [Pseudogracilibacillus sp. SO30301A]|uniref:hypothetical protein n=1 Tax=Pseudogracilibacillus sp. SO30301A TaxID=3098291 RepID=UPI00300E41F1
MVYVSKSADRECSFYDTVGNHLYDYNVKETKGLITKPESDIHLFLKYKYGNRKFWCRGYFVDTLGRNKNQFHEYIRNQLKDDYMSDQLSAAEQITSSHWWF